MKERKIISTGEFNLSMSMSQWNRLCDRFLVPRNFVPQFISKGVEQQVFTFGARHVLKFTDRDFIVKTAKALRGKNIPMVARCYAVIRVMPHTHCVVQELCKPLVGTEILKPINDLSHVFAVTKGYEDKVIMTAKTLRRLKAQSIVDLHAANIMTDLNGNLIISDYGCVRF